MRQTRYMRDLQRNKIRELTQSGYTQTMVADQLKLTTRQIRNYLTEIRKEDYAALAAENESHRASAIESAKAEFTRIKMFLLNIMLDEHSTKQEVMEAADRIRTIELDLVNLRINGPLAIGLNNAANRLLSGTRKAEENALSLPEDGEPTTTRTTD
jgi:predicted transcriptional regulator